MKIQIVLVMLLACLASTGCQSTNVSSQGGIAPINEAFSITVPKTMTVKQGTNTAVTVALNRGDYFKQDVELDLTTAGIIVSPNSVLVKASDKPVVQCQITVARDAAIGDYRVTVTGTPAKGTATSTIIIVSVVAQ